MGGVAGSYIRFPRAVGRKAVPVASRVSTRSLVVDTGAASRGVRQFLALVLPRSFAAWCAMTCI